MKVLISAGVRSNKIEEGLRNRFKAGGIDFIIVPFMDDIDDIYQRGEYFDKAIIVEQSWNHDYSDADEMSIRTRINKFAQQSFDRDLSNVSFVFLTQDEATANSVYEEIVPIEDCSVVVVKPPRYTVTFFASLVTTEIDKIDSQIVYKPKIDAEVEVESAPIQLEKPSPISYDADYGYDPASEFDIRPEDNANRLDIDSGIDMEFNQDDLGEGTEGTEKDIGTDNDFDGGLNDGFDGGFDTDIEEPSHFNFEKSGELGNDSFDLNEAGMEIPSFEQSNGFDNNEPKGEEVPVNDFGYIEEPEVFEENNDQSGDIPDWSGIDTNEQDGFNFDKDSGQGDQDMGYDEPDIAGYDDMEQQGTEDMYSESGNIPNMSGDNLDDSMYDQYNPELDQYSRTQMSGFNGDPYAEEAPVPAPSRRQYKRSNLSNDQIRDTLDAFANRGNSILVTGCGGCGTSTIAFNLANIINRLGYTVLLVDLDTENKAQSYISKDSYECLEPESAGLMAAVNSTSGINAHIAIVRQGFHLLTMGMASDSAPIEKLLHKEKFSRFINLAKTSHNFVIYDVPFKTAVGFGSEFTFMADNIVVTVDCSNWGITKTMLSMCNFESDDMQEIMFNRGQLLFNRHRVVHKIMGRKVKTATDITKVMDFKVKELIGEDPGYYFQTMHICGIINDDPNFEAGWFDSTQYSDTANGSKIFIEVLKNIVLKQ